MLKNIILIAVVWGLSDARPKTVKLNVAEVPPNCKDGQEWVNDQCREIWGQLLELQNVASAPPNCQPSQQYIKGQCRDIWFPENQQSTEDSLLDQKNVVTVPPNCPPGQEWINGACREIWRSNGFQPANVITVPPNCPIGQEYINGQCREIWLRLNPTENIENSIANKLHQPHLLDKIVAAIQSEISDGSGDTSNAVPDNQQSGKNIISIPNQCPAGYRPDANGVCREIWTRVVPTTM